VGTSVAAVEEAGLHEPGLAARSFSAVREVVRRRSGLFGLVVVGALVLIAAFAPLIAPYDPATQDIFHRLEGPTWSHLLGTDHLGRDLLSRIIFGARIALSVAVPAVAIALTCGLVLGLAAGYFGGWIDNALVVVMDALQAFPAVILALALLALLGPSQRNVLIVIGVAFTPGYARVGRALVYSTKQNQFVEAQRALGARHHRIVLVHVLPNIIAPLLVLMAMDIPSAVTTEAGLSFLGLGVQPPTPSWGVILADGFTYVRESPWAIIWASAALIVTTLGFTMLGEALRDVFDPRVTAIRRWRRN
jgi:peptide/nickel transport system permease protein